MPTFDVGEGPRALVAGDFNKDGNQDLVAANYDGNAVSVLFGTGDGAFAAKVYFATGVGPNSLAVGNLNDDEWLDLATANSDSNTISVLLGMDGGGFAPKVDYAAGNAPHDVVIAHLDGDDKQDVAVSSDGLFILRGNGDGTLQPMDRIAETGYRSLRAHDLNQDGALDLVAVDQYVRVLLASDDAPFTALEGQEPSVYYVGGLVVGDFDGDTVLDLGLGDLGGRGPSPAFRTFPGNGDGTFDMAAGTTLDEYTNYDGLSAGDFNHDDKVDIVGCSGSTLEVFFGAAKDEARYACTAQVRCGSTALSDLDGDGELDIAFTAQTGFSSVLSVLLGRGDGTFKLGPREPGGEP